MKFKTPGGGPGPQNPVGVPRLRHAFHQGLLNQRGQRTGGHVVLQLRRVENSQRVPVWKPQATVC